MSASQRTWLVVVLLLAAVGGVGWWAYQRQFRTPDMVRALDLNNKGIGLIEQFESNASPAAFEPLPIAGVVDQDAAHRFRGGGEEMAPTVEPLVADLHLFGGLGVEEAGEALGISRASAYRNWKYARAWLRDALEK